MNKLYNFLERLKSEQLEFKLSYTDLGYISIEIDAFSERWIVEFDDEEDVNIDIFKSVENINPEDESLLENLFDRVQKAWLKAADDLGIEVIPDYLFHNSENKKFNCSIYLPHFGNKTGTLLFNHKDSDQAHDEGSELGYYICGLNPVHYDHYSRENFIDLLNDLEWFGASDPPKWYIPKKDNL